MAKRAPRHAVLAMALSTVPLLLGGCTPKGMSHSDKAPSAKKIALLLPEAKTARYESKDRPLFEAKLKSLCAECEIFYANANQDAAQQQSQAEAALTNGASVLVLDAVDGASAAAIAKRAKATGVPVIAYDRLITGTDAVDYYVSFDNEAIGRLQARSLLDALGGNANASVIAVHGAPTDNNAALFKKGALGELEGKVRLAKQYDTPDWSPDKARDETSQALTALGNRVDAVYAANDGMAGGAIAALKAAGVHPLPPVTGQDAEIAAVQRIVQGEQYMTVYKAISLEAAAAADLAFRLVTKSAIPRDLTQGKTVNNGSKDVPAVLLVPVAVTRKDIKRTLFADGFWTPAQVCTPPYAEACSSAGLL